MLIRKLIYPVLAMASALAVLVAGPVQASGHWQPKKPVEFIIMAGTGGGADQIARLLQGLIEKKGLSSRPFIPINKSLWHPKLDSRRSTDAFDDTCPGA